MKTRLLFLTIATIALLAISKPIATMTTATQSVGTTAMSFTASSGVISRDTHNVASFRVAGSLHVTNAGEPAFSTNPWTLLYGKYLQHGIIHGVMAVGFTKPYLAHLSGQKQADVVLSWYSCGADCGDSSAILSWNAKLKTYRKVAYATAQEWDPLSKGKLVHLNATHDAIATHVSGPFDDCHACQPGTIPMLLVVRSNAAGVLRITDISATQPATLIADANTALAAARAHTGAKGDPIQQSINYYRYLADRCRLNACKSAWKIVNAAYDSQPGATGALTQMHDSLKKQGFTR